MKRLAALILAYVFLVFAIIGLFLPILPTVPFLLLAAWFSTRGSKRLHRWLYTHPSLGKMLIDWEQQRAISRKSKIISVIILIASWSLLYILSYNVWMLTGLAVLFVVVSSYIITRPEPV